jgi:hypothetical protein
MNWSRVSNKLHGLLSVPQFLVVGFGSCIFVSSFGYIGLIRPKSFGYIENFLTTNLMFFFTMKP